MSDDLLQRVERFERTVAVCLCVLPALFSLQCVGMALTVPVFKAMFADFGAPLPALTDFVLRMQVLWIAIGLLVPVLCVVRACRGSPRSAVATCTVAGLFVFFLAQFITVAMFMPVLQLGAVSK